MRCFKITGLLLLVTILAKDVHAQRFGRSRGEFRGVSHLKIGMNVNYFSGDFPGDGAARVGLNVGLAPTIQLQGQFYIKPELSFSQRGGRIDYDQTFSGFDGNVVYRLNYIDLPLIIGYRFGPMLSVEAGVFAAFEVGGNFDFQGTFFSGYGFFDREDVEDFNYGLALGIKVGPIGFRYYYGLQEIASAPEVIEFLGNAATHSVQIYLQRASRRKSANGI